jgi:hypothetical protein
VLQCLDVPSGSLERIPFLCQHFGVARREKLGLLVRGNSFVVSLEGQQGTRLEESAASLMRRENQRALGASERFRGAPLRKKCNAFALPSGSLVRVSGEQILVA